MFCVSLREPQLAWRRSGHMHVYSVWVGCDFQLENTTAGSVWSYAMLPRCAKRSNQAAKQRENSTKHTEQSGPVGQAQQLTSIANAQAAT